jgi:hypothetical protein
VGLHERRAVWGNRNVGYEARRGEERRGEEKPTDTSRTQEISLCHIPLICAGEVFLPVEHNEDTRVPNCMCSCSQENMPVGPNIIYQAFSFMPPLTSVSNSLSLNPALFFSK